MTKPNPTVTIMTFGESEYDTIILLVGKNCDGMNVETLVKLERQLREECPEELSRMGEYILELTDYEPPTDYGDGFMHDGFWEFKVLDFQKHTFDMPEFDEGRSTFLYTKELHPEKTFSAEEICPPYASERQKQAFIDGWDSERLAHETYH